MTRFKVRISSEEQSLKIQEIIFKNDPIVAWGGKDGERKPKHTDKPFLFYVDHWPSISYEDKIDLFDRAVFVPELTYDEVLEKYG
jgi:hypothetical protein